VITGFGTFPGAPRNATAEMIAAIAEAAGIVMQRSSFRVPDLITGRGAIDGARVSLMVLPVLWEAAGALVAKEARATRASLVVMTGIANKVSEITIEGFATSARRKMKDRFGVTPAFKRGASRARETTFDTEIARAAAETALAREDLAIGVARRGLDPDNSYVCNATAHVASQLASRGTRVLRSSNAPDGVFVPRMNAVHGFVHWPAEIPPDRVAACARVLVAMVSALIAKRAAEAA
jgi:pyrrolidone-carboxylate peptidase